MSDFTDDKAPTHHEASQMAEIHERRVRQLSTLYELNKALLTSVNFERIIQITLTAITIGGGLGFNRAMLFLVDGKNRTLNGTSAVGPNSAEEAGRIWADLSQRGEPLSDLIAGIDPSAQDSSPLDFVVKGIQIPLERKGCILSRTVLEGRSHNIPFPQPEAPGPQSHCEGGCHLGLEVGCYMGERLTQSPRAYSFATVPLWGKGRVIGVILVDNLFNQNPITEEDIHFLSLFSNKAGLAIENGLLYRNLEEVHQELRKTQDLLVHQEKMAALGEMSETIAHQIKNPLVTIGGFARRLYLSIPEGATEKRYAQTIVKEVARVEMILNDMLNYAREGSSALQELDLREVLEESLSMIIEGFDTAGLQIFKDFAQVIPGVKGNYEQLKLVFFNLIHNAYEAMKGLGSLSLRLHFSSEPGSSLIRVEVGDTGGGIDPENLHNIFNPFFTTKDSSSGLGLPTVHKIVTSHGGQIEIDNRPGRGVNFIIFLPVHPGRAGTAIIPKLYSKEGWKKEPNGVDKK